MNSLSWQYSAACLMQLYGNAVAQIRMAEHEGPSELKSAQKSLLALFGVVDKPDSNIADDRRQKDAFECLRADILNYCYKTTIYYLIVLKLSKDSENEAKGFLSRRGENLKEGLAFRAKITPKTRSLVKSNMLFYERVAQRLVAEKNAETNTVVEASLHEFVACLSSDYWIAVKDAELLLSRGDNFPSKYVAKRMARSGKERFNDNCAIFARNKIARLTEMFGEYDLVLPVKG